MSGQFANKRIERWPIAKLTTSPHQHLFAPLSDRQLQDLATSLTDDKLIYPVEILPHGEIICGHNRVAAAKLLGWTHIHCWVRHDLAAAGEDAVIHRLIDDNRNRRQLTKMGMGRAFLALKEREYEGWRATEQARGDFRDYLGEILGVDGSTAERWAQLARLPTEYESLIESGHLTQQLAHRIAKSLPADVQKQLVKKLLTVAQEDGPRSAKKQKIRSIVERNIGPARNTRPTKLDWPQQVLRALEKSIATAPESITAVTKRLAESNVDRKVVSLVAQRLPNALAEVAELSIELDDQDMATLQTGALLVLGLLSATSSSAMQ